MVNPTKVNQACQLVDQALQLLREDRDLRAVTKETGGRELSEAITAFETGCMKMIRSKYAEKPYSPMDHLNGYAEQNKTVVNSESSTGAPAA